MSAFVADSDKPQVVIEDQVTESTPEEQAEAYYWLTITDFVKLMVEHGPDKVMGDFKMIASKVQADIQKEHPIIRV